MTDEGVVRAFVDPNDIINYRTGLNASLRGTVSQFRNIGWNALALSEWEALALYAYSSAEPYHLALNARLREGCISETDEYVIALLNRSLAKVPGFRGAAYRGILLSSNEIEEKLGHYEPGEMICWPAFSSASLMLEAAFAGNVIFKIESTRLNLIAFFSRYPRELEVLFKKKSAFVVRLRQKNENGVLAFVLKEVRQ